MKKNSLLFHISLALKTLAITMPHSFLTFVLLGKGVTYAQIAIIQSMFSCAMVLFEFPSGLLADRYNKKAVYIASNITLIISYFVIYKFSSYGILCLAWFLYGLSNAFQTGTIDAEMIILMKRRQDKGKSLEKFLGELNQISAVSSLLGSIIGFSLYQFIKIDIYLVMVTIITFTTLLIALGYKNIYLDINGESRNSLLTIIKSSFHEITKNRILGLSILSMGIIQIFFQIHFQLWQTYFIGEGFKENVFLLIYLLFQGISFTVFKLPIRKASGKTFITTGLVAIAISVVLLMTTSRKYFALFLYSVIVALVYALSFKVSLLFNSEVKDATISSTTSISSTIMRIFGMVTLWFAGLFLKYSSVKILFFLGTLITVVFSVIIIIYCHTIQNEKVVKLCGPSHGIVSDIE